MFGFLFKCTIAFAVFLLIYPELKPGEDPSPEASGSGAAAAASVLEVVRAALLDASGFCERRPDACAGAAVAVDAIGHRIGEGASSLARSLSPSEAAEGASLPIVAADKGDRGTLTDADLTAGWSLPATH